MKVLNLLLLNAQAQGPSWCGSLTPRGWRRGWVCQGEDSTRELLCLWSSGLAIVSPALWPVGILPAQLAFNDAHHRPSDQPHCPPPPWPSRAHWTAFSVSG